MNEMHAAVDEWYIFSSPDNAALISNLKQKKINPVKKLDKEEK